MKAHEMREQSLEELISLEKDKAEELMQLNIKLSMHQLDNPLQVRELRREVAVIKTVINQKRAAGE